MLRPEIPTICAAGRHVIGTVTQLGGRRGNYQESLRAANNNFDCSDARLAVRGTFLRGIGAEKEKMGTHFAHKTYEPKTLAQFAKLRSRLPSPIYVDNPLFVPVYWKAWELAFHNFREPAPNTGFVSQFIDAAFNQYILLWDSCLMSMFCNYAYPLVHGISSLDNFYAKQHEDGEISRAIVRATGAEYGVNHEDKPLYSRAGWFGYDEPLKYDRNVPVICRGRAVPYPNLQLTLDALDHPLLAWAELEHYSVTGDKDRLGRV